MNMRWRTYSIVPLAVMAAGPVSGWAAQYMTMQEAQKLCFPGADAFVPSDITLTREQRRAVEKDSGVRARTGAQKLWRAMRGQEFLGWFIKDEVLGKHELITWALALGPDGAVRLIEILDYRETYGYEVRGAQWRAQFYGKKHGAPLKLDKDIKNIGGATLSCRHITDGVKRLLSFYELFLK